MQVKKGSGTEKLVVVGAIDGRSERLESCLSCKLILCGAWAGKRIRFRGGFT